MISARRAGSLPSLGWKSTSTPRSRKICTAASERASEMRTLGTGFVSGLTYVSGKAGSGGAGSREGPIEPRQQRLNVRGIDRGAAPDAQARRRVAITTDVVGGPLGFQQLRHALDEIALTRVVEGCDPGIGETQADGGVRACCRAGDEVLDPGGAVGPGLNGGHVRIGAGAGGIDT